MKSNLTKKELDRFFNGGYYFLLKDINIENEWISENENNIFLFEDLHVRFWRKVDDSCSTYRIDISLKTFNGSDKEIILYSDFSNMFFRAECKSYLEGIFKRIILK